jgi:putative nucleotidyltransferase with HDIG domain
MTTIRTSSTEERLARIRELLPEIEQISRADAREAVVQIWDQVWRESEWDDLATIPKNGSAPLATEKVHGAWTLVTHARTVAQLAVANAEILTKLHGLEFDRDALLVIALLHDASKVVEYIGSPEAVEKGRFGELIQHGVYGSFLMWQHNLPLEWIHAVISHTPSSAVPPKTQEALIVRYVDFLDTDAMLLDIGGKLHIG